MLATQHAQHEHEVLFSSEPRPGLRSGDIVALVTQDAAAHPYAVLRELDPEAHEDEPVEDRHVYRLVVDESAGSPNVHALQTSHPSTHVEMVKSSSGGSDGRFWCFRAPMAHDRFLQGTRKAACRLRFSSVMCGTWEEWEIDPKESDDLRAPWTRRDVTFRHRRLEKLELRVTLVRLGRDSIVMDGDDDDVGDGGDEDDPSTPSNDGTKMRKPGSRAKHRGQFSNLLYSRAIRKYASADRLVLKTSGGAAAGSSPDGRGAAITSINGGGGGGGGSGSDSLASSSHHHLGRSKTVDQTKEHTSVLHMLSGTMAGALAKELQRENAARAALEKEMMELHSASEGLRVWALRELDRLRGYAQEQVDELVNELAMRDAQVGVAEYKLSEEIEVRQRAEEASAKHLAAATHMSDWCVKTAHRRGAAALLARVTRGWIVATALARRATKAAERMWRRRMQSLARDALTAWWNDAAAAARQRDMFARAVSRFRANSLGKALHVWILFATDAAAARGLAEKRTREWTRRRRMTAFVAWRDVAVERFYYMNGDRRGGGDGGGG